MTTRRSVPFLPAAAGLLLLAALASPAAGQCVSTGSTAFWQVTAPGCVTPATLSAANDPVLGTTTVLTTANAPIASVVVMSVVLPPNVPAPATLTLAGFPLLPGCSNYLPNPDGYIVDFAFAGSVSAALPIPNDPWWIGKVVHCQSAVIDLGTLGIEMSNGVCLFCGL